MGNFRILGILFFFTSVVADAGSSRWINDPPVAQNQNLVTMEDTSLPLTLTGSDVNNDVLTFNVVQGPLHGILSGNPPNLSYSPNQNFNGSDSFTFTVNDGTLDSEIATVTISVQPINDPPVPTNLAVSVAKNKSKSILLSATDADNQSLTYGIQSSPTHGVLTGSGQSLIYTPESNYTGNDVFTFSVSDGMGAAGIGTVSITVEDVNRYMVFFNDKQGTPFSVDSPEEFLSARSLQRRTINEVSVSEEDLPVSSTYVSGLENIGAKVLYKTNWMNGVMVEATASQIDEIELLEYVKSSEYIAPGERPIFSARIRSSKKLPPKYSATAANNSTQNSMIGLDVMHSFNFRGEGVLVAIMDAGFTGADTISSFRHIYNEGRFDAVTSYNFVSGGNNVFVGDAHGTNVWSIMGAYKSGVYTGGVYKANFVLFVTEYDPSEYRVEEYNWLFAAERADSLGVDVINTSLGYNTFDDGSMNYTKAQMNGTTALISRAASIAANKGIAVVVSAGNSGSSSWGIITAPADVETILSIGGVTSTGIKVGSSSTGPTADGRIKPDVAAMGTGVLLVESDGTLRTGTGTSFASPLAASLVAGLRQRFPTITVAQLFDSVRMNATQSLTPDNLLGYGIPSFANFVTGVIPESNKPTLTVYPIPTGATCFLQFSEANPEELRCSLFDSRGTSLEVNATREDDFRYSLDLTTCKPGLYVLRIQRGRDLYTHKIIKSE
jgi:serine protease AprX